MRSYTCPGSVALSTGVYLLLAAVQDGIHGAQLFVPSCGVGSSCSSAVDSDSDSDAPSDAEQGEQEPVPEDDSASSSDDDEADGDAGGAPSLPLFPLCGLFGARQSQTASEVTTTPPPVVHLTAQEIKSEPVLVDAPHDHDTRNASPPPPPGSSAHLPLCGFFGRDKSKSNDVVETRPQPMKMNNQPREHRELKEGEYITLRGYHGTGLHNLPGIYVQGWQESTHGFYGPGLYLTNKLATAEHYAWKSFPWPTVMLVTYRVRRDRLLDAVLLLQEPREVEDQDLDRSGTTDVAPTNSSSSSRSPGRSSSDRRYCYRSGSPLNSVSSSRRLVASFPAAAEDYDVLFRVNQVLVQVDRVEILSTRPLALYGTALGVKWGSRWRGESADSAGDLTRENLQKLGYSSEEIKRAVT